MPINNKDNFIGRWEQFFHNLGEVCNRKIQERNDLRFNPLANLLKKVINEITSDKAKSELKKELRNLSYDDKKAIDDFIAGEMDFFNKLVMSGSEASDKSKGFITISTDETIDKGKTIKDSIKAIIPGFLKKPLDILNELISLIRSV